jgi:bifunctional DNA-binding transcriptional regulator/antitoxin component of YhaV-PrlF toxin-antitoxin module
MKLQKTAKVQTSATNVTVNIPVEQREALGISGGDTVLLTADTKTKKITIEKLGG